MIVATLLTPFTPALDFAFDTATNATLKRIGGTWDKAAKVWTLPLRNLDRLIAKCGNELMCDTEVWLAAPVREVATSTGTGKAADLEPTRFDTLLADNLPRWAARAAEQKQMQAQRKARQWHTFQASNSLQDGRLK